MKKRILWIDILNVLSCFGVLLMHVSNGQIHEWDGNKDLAFFWGLFTHTFFYWPVPVFLMLSGLNILSHLPQDGHWGIFFRKRINKAVIPFVLWSVLYSAPFIAQKKVTGWGGRRILYVPI